MSLEHLSQSYNLKMGITDCECRALVPGFSANLAGNILVMAAQSCKWPHTLYGSSAAAM